MPGDHEQLEQMLSPYLDGELTQHDQQRVRVWLEDSAEAREHLGELERIKQATESMAFVPPPDGRMDEIERSLSVQAPRRLGWVLLLLGAAAVLAALAVGFVAAPGIPGAVKGVGAIIGGGLALLLGSVARQRRLELPHDRYRGVKR